MRDELWSTDRQTDRLRDVRSDGRALWADSAARDIGARWLDPHDGLAATVVDQSRAQSEAIGVALRAQREADAHAQVAATRAADTVGWLHRAEEATERARGAAAQAQVATDHADRTTATARSDSARARLALDSAR